MLLVCYVLADHACALSGLTVEWLLAFTMSYLASTLPLPRCSHYTSEVQEKFVPTLMAGFKLWIPAHIVNFALVPTRQRVLYANVCRSRRGCVVLKLCSNCGHPAGLSASH